ncbi:TIGR03668 family PPOX class F420-dependent oxidoreductase [Streptomyces sp. MI02-2A]|uniref:TIGR03668 family PPOX class F420-dependent oxidoreductase n=1 Tax=unclassified Streptomyces TaxID=2593676 RepID=UPI00074134B9|nr:MULTISPECIES: TIGR03668 family PPOX class F420-dependent oxidoreductase [unclassified Streptomyces]KUJ39484.1 F420-dependent protein [Streptomyces sp. NRRL F-5122]MDX3264818.1 TIGR03668 family PPOX class F420-dependent oxidoreductase [Streptomyces sp. MI02-2A]REE59052.1 PPOX class probable F420-dependent enzyme [Streptomyces sp. 3212.3]
MPRMAEGEARRRFAGSPVARLATVDPQGHPHLVPVVFAVHGDAVVTAVDRKPKSSPRLKRLHNIAARPAVCLLVDVYDEDWGRLWWVRADGDAHTVLPEAPGERDREEYRSALALLTRKYPQYRDWPPDGPVIVVAVHRWSGWEAASGSRAQG